MKIIHILTETQLTEAKKGGGISGTNCGNCEHTKGEDVVKAKSEEINEQGGTIPADERQMKLAKKADLITMPGKPAGNYKVMCNHPRVAQYVNSRMCCAFWDSPGTLRAYGDQAIGK